jgi:hypothetical protein
MILGLQKADYNRGESGDAYDVRNYSYDPDGNILGLERFDHQGGYLDQLSYDYFENGGLKENNRLKRLTDSQSSDAIRTNSSDMTYDPNGNMLSDDSKGIAAIVYNAMNLPILIKFDDGQYIEYWYDGAGNRIYKYYSGDSGGGNTIGDLYILDEGATRCVRNIQYGDGEYTLDRVLFWPLQGVGGKILPEEVE